MLEELDVVDAVLLDAGGVLLLPDPESIRREAAPFGVIPDDDTCRRAHFASMRELDRIGAVDWVAVDRVLCRVLGIPDDRIDDALAGMERVYIEYPWVPEKGAAEAIARIEGDGYPVAIVSNANGSMERQLADHRICSVDGTTSARVEVVIDSHVVGVEKPDPKIFALAFDALDPRLAVAPQRCVYAGDTVYFDVNGARAAGLVPVHVDPFGLCPATDDHAHVASIGELAQHLAARRT